jgi:hypothetical protein
MQIPWERPHDEWRRASRAGLAGWLIFYALFLLHAVRDADGFLLLDHVNLIIHEAGHFFFAWFGHTLNILGGTLGQLLVPLLIGVYFWWHRETTGTAFSAFWFFQNFLYVGWYMNDARRLALPLVGSGDHDWEILFGQWGVLHLDQKIGGTMRALGWLGMLVTVAWFAWFAWRNESSRR